MSSCSPVFDRIRPDTVRPDVWEVLKPFYLEDATVDRVAKVMEHEMALGLSACAEDRKKTCLQMEPTFVEHLFNGSEHGQFIALDLGGTNFRILLVSINYNNMDYDVQIYRDRIPEQVLIGSASGVFEYLAESLCHFVDQFHLDPQKTYPLGFTFSFPMHQSALNKATLVTWTKSFRCPDGVGEDAVELLEHAVARKAKLAHGKMLSINAILNDTTGTLMAGARADPKFCRIGFIIGTGSNACYMERLAHVPRYQSSASGTSQWIAIDVEWGAFGDNGCLSFLQTDIDVTVDKLSNHVGSFTFEKYFSGYYLGDLTRLLLTRLIKDKFLFVQLSSELIDKCLTLLLEHRSVTSENHIAILADKSGELSTGRQFVYNYFGLNDTCEVTLYDLELIRFACQVLSDRACKMISIALAVLLRHISLPEVSIAADGSLYECHPFVATEMERLLKVFVPQTQSRIFHARDGSGEGAALVAAVAKRVSQLPTVST